MLYFFLSYAHGDDPQIVAQFFRDLSEDVREVAGVRSGTEVGFYDRRSLTVGDRWDESLVNALSQCRSLIALSSPRYYLSEFCGREWRVFSDRLNAYRRATHQTAPALLPIIWTPTELPEPVSQLQYTDAQLGGELYHQYGLRQMLRISRFNDDYRELVFKLANKIVQIAKTYEVPRPRRPIKFNEVRSAFGLPTAALAAAGAESGEPATHARGKVHFVIVAGSRTEMAHHRNELTYYGLSRADWAPYQPGFGGALAQHAGDVAGAQYFRHEICDIDGLANRLAGASERNEVVVLLVDAWSAALAEHRSALAEYDGRNEPTTAVMVPFNSDDGETLDHTPILQARLRDVLGRTVRRGDLSMFRPNLPTADRFGTALRDVLNVAQNRIFRTGPVHAPVPPGPPRPILEGPSELNGPTRPGVSS